MIKASIGISKLRRIQATPSSVASHRHHFATMLQAIFVIRVSDEKPTSNIRCQNYGHTSSEGIKAVFIGWLQSFREDL